MTYFLNKLIARKFPRKLKATPLHATFKSRNGLFVHIPKAAGSAVCMSLFGHQVGHKKIADYYFSDYQGTASLFKFAFVRHPITRFESSFHFLRSNSPFLSDKGMQQQLAKFADINAFCDAFLADPKSYSSLHFVPQYQFLSYTGNRKDKQIGVDYIGRFESIDEDFATVCQQLGVSRELPQLNVNKQLQRLSLDAERSERLREYYDTDFYLFGYNL
ncbi:sulfotransferase family 2 domain-containing protein [Idiomarina seosinensis]|uniref:Sulfotransferase family protein n=1 Tax=Idiomarina seosinensis TaxID=281739 RepID=A0A432ZD34_9GAMM|nr:sulfotransferase family 2 domain-containing protein [Idiomarina seosinensis]RUO75809.1 hypothetical protein CWI81_06690 [Idiomarina seosinensis]